MWQEGETIVGVGPEILSDACKKLGIPLKIAPEGGWDEVIEKARKGEIDAVVALFMNDERKKYLDFSTSFDEDPVVLFVRKDKSFPYHNWKDLIGRKGTTTVGDSYGQEFDRFIAEKLNVSRLKTLKDNFDALLDGRADYFIYSMYPGLLETKKEEIDGRITYLKPYLTTESWRLAFSKKSKYRKYLPAINSIIADMISRGQVEKWVVKYNAYFEEHVLDRVKRLVNSGIEYYLKNGEDKAFAEFDNLNGQFSKGDLYLFVYDFKGTCVAHGQDHSLIGRNLLNTKDPNGIYFIKEFISIAKNPGEGWVSYKWEYNKTGEIIPKISFIKRVKGKDILVGCGFYPEK